jgi:glycosyltransferase involved in cell wall biosynthesis
MRQFGVSQPIRVIENGVNLQPFLNPHNPLNKQTLNLKKEHVLAVYVGRLSPEKNLPLLIKEFALAHQQRPQLRLLLIGDGPLSRKLRQQIQTAGLSDAIIFTGVIPYHEVANYLAAADLFVTASVSEVHPLTVIEAMAAGLPIIGQNAPGLSDSVTAGSGILVEGGQGTLARALITLTDAPGQRQKMGAMAQEESKRFDIMRTVNQTIALYEELMDERVKANTK